MQHGAERQSAYELGRHPPPTKRPRRQCCPGRPPGAPASCPGSSSRSTETTPGSPWPRPPRKPTHMKTARDVTVLCKSEPRLHELNVLLCVTVCGWHLPTTGCTELQDCIGSPVQGRSRNACHVDIRVHGAVLDRDWGRSRPASPEPQESVLQCIVL